MLAEASRGLKEAIAVVKCALINSTRLAPPSSSPPESRSGSFVPRSIAVVLGGGSAEMALASRLRSEYKTGTTGDCAAARVFVRALEGMIFLSPLLLPP